MKLAYLAPILAACSLLSKAPPLDIAYFSPAVPAAATEAPVAPSGPKIRLRRVFGGSHLRSRIAYRTSEVELDYYETRRWAEPPEEYARRALERALFSRGVLVTGGVAPELEVEVLAFEEVRGPVPAGRVQLRYRLVDDERRVIAEDTVDVSRQAGTTFESKVTAIGAALRDASARLSRDVIARLERIADRRP